MICFQLKAPPKRKKVANRRKNKNFQKHNDHMGDVLKDYSEEAQITFRLYKLLTSLTGCDYYVVLESDFVD